VPESSSHIRLVSELRRWIAVSHFNGELAYVLSDTAGMSSTCRTPCIRGYVPDAYARTIVDDRIIVGEAKTSGDLENRHSIAQIETFFSYCNDVNGILIIAVPWHRVAFEKNFLSQLSRRKGYDTSCCAVLDGLPE